MSHSCALCADCSNKDFCSHRQHGRKKGVLLINLGTPDNTDTASVRRYLAEFLSDPFVIRLPRMMRWFQKPLGHFIALMRGSKSAHAYKQIWTPEGSPIKVITQAQCNELKNRLPHDWNIYYAMRYAKPSIKDTLKRIMEDHITELIVVPMYAQYSGPTTGTAVEELFEAMKSLGHDFNLEVRNTWYEDAGYIDAQARLIYEQAIENGLSPENSILMFSAHSMPVSYIEAGDPYECHVRRSVTLIGERLGWPEERIRLAFQSKLGPVPWLGPETTSVLREIADENEKNVLVCPISFTADCLETLEEIGIRYKNDFEAAGGTLYLCPALNTFEPFINALTQLIRRGPHNVDECNKVLQPLFTISFDVNSVNSDNAIESLVMIGTSVQPRMNGVKRPLVQHVSIEEFKNIKRPQQEAVKVLQTLKKQTGIEECLILNTCNRYELYGMLTLDTDLESIESGINNTQKVLLNGYAKNASPLNVLRGREAWLHLLRSSAGLNSTLPGDTEVLDQLHSAKRLAQHAGTMGDRTELLINQTSEIVNKVRDTVSSRICNQYCYAALQELKDRIHIPLSVANFTIIGGSATSCSFTTALKDHFGVEDKQLTMIYRGGGQRYVVRRIRKLINNGTRLKVNSYSEDAVIHSIKNADIVVYGIDQKVPCLFARDICTLRNYMEKPLTVIDFNSFNSTQDLDTIDGITLIQQEEIAECVEAYAASKVFDTDFLEAFHEAEKLLDQYALPQDKSLALAAASVEVGA